MAYNLFLSKDFSSLFLALARFGVLRLLHVMLSEPCLACTLFPHRRARRGK
jgi:hypothetical protein